MITKTFSHIDGISPAFETLLWTSGIRQWDDFLAQKERLAKDLPKSKLDKIEQGIFASKEAHANNDLQYFKNLLKPREHWRLCSMGKIAYVDIETTGLSRWSNEITLIGIYDGVISHLYVNGKNLEEAEKSSRNSISS